MSGTPMQNYNFQRANGRKSKHAVYETVLSNQRYGANNSATYIPTTKIQQSQRQKNSSNSQASKNSQHSSLLTQQIACYQKLSQLSQRLKNIHHFYRIRIDQQKSKSSERNQVFMGIMQQLQKSHLDKITTIQLQIQSAQEEKKQVSFVDDKMSGIKGSIDDILKQSATFKLDNQKLEKQIVTKEQNVNQRQKLLQKLKKQQIDFRDQLENFQKANLKENKRQKQMLEMLNSVASMR